jgi:hypothetical protein
VCPAEYLLDRLRFIVRGQHHQHVHRVTLQLSL